MYHFLFTIFRSKSIDENMIFKHCNIGSQFLEDSLTCNKCKSPIGMKLVSFFILVIYFSSIFTFLSIDLGAL